MQNLQNMQSVQDLQKKPTKTNIPNKTYQPSLPHQTYQIKPSKPNLPNQIYQTKPTKRDRVQEAYTAQRQTRAASKPLSLGQRVWLQDQNTKRWSIGGVVKSIRNGGKSYVVETHRGAYLRNRRYIKAATSRITLEMVTKDMVVPAKQRRDKKERKVRFYIPELAG